MEILRMIRSADAEWQTEGIKIFSQNQQGYYFYSDVIFLPP